MGEVVLDAAEVIALITSASQTPILKPRWGLRILKPQRKHPYTLHGHILLSKRTHLTSEQLGTALNLRTTTLQKCAVIPRRARI